MPPTRVISCCLVLVAVILVARADIGLSTADTAAVSVRRHGTADSSRIAAPGRRPPWAMKRNARREAADENVRLLDSSTQEHHRPLVKENVRDDISSSADRRAGGPSEPTHGHGRQGRSSSASMFVRSTYSAPFRRPISFGRLEPTELPLTFSTPPPPTQIPSVDERQTKRKRVKLIRFIDNEGNVDNVETQTVPDVNNNDLHSPTAPAATPEPAIEGAESSKTGSSNSLLDIGKPGNPYELIQVAFPPNSRVKPHAVTTNELVENDLTDFDPSEIYFTDGNLLVLRGGSFPKNYKPADPGPPIDSYRAPFREPKLPPTGLEFGGPLPQFPPRPGTDPFGGPPDPFAINVTAFDLCPLKGPCQPLLFPPLIGEHPPPDGIRPIVLIHPDVKVSKLKQPPANSVYPNDAHLYMHYANNHGRPQVVNEFDPYAGVDEVLRETLGGFFPPPGANAPESVGAPQLPNVPPAPPSPRPPRPRPRPTQFPTRPPGALRPTKPPKKIYFPHEEMFEFPEIVTRRPKPNKNAPGTKPVLFPQAGEKNRPLTKYEQYQELIGSAKVSPWVPRLSRRPDGTIQVDPSHQDPHQGGPNPNFAASSPLSSQANFFNFRPNSIRNENNQQFQLQGAFSEDFSAFPVTTPGPTTLTPKPPSLQHDIDVNFKQPLPPINPISETLPPKFNTRPRFTDPVKISQFTTPVSPFESALASLQTQGFLTATARPTTLFATLNAQQFRFSPQSFATPTISPTAAAVAAAAVASPFNAITAQPVINRLSPLHGRAIRLQQAQAQQQSLPYVRYLLHMGHPSAQPLIQYTQFLGRRRR